MGQLCHIGVRCQGLPEPCGHEAQQNEYAQHGRSAFPGGWCLLGARIGVRDSLRRPL
jgi:hypothetical protein